MPPQGKIKIPMHKLLYWFQNARRGIRISLELDDVKAENGLTHER